MQFGLLPSIQSHSDPKHYLESYVTTYLREEVLQEGLTRNIGDFTRFLEAASFSQGEMLNMTDVGREAAIERRVVSAYFDAGVYRTLRPKGPLDSPEEIDGPVLETLFIEHLRALNDYYHLGYQFYFWRTQSQLEVDFVAYGEKGLIAFEIKRKRNISSKDLKGLKAFGSDYEMAELYLLHGGSEEEYHGDIRVIPFEKALFQLKEILKCPS